MDEWWKRVYWAPATFLGRLLYGFAAAAVLFAAALYIGSHRPWAALSLIGTSIVLEAQPAAVASVALGFHPLTGAVISILANLIPIPVLMLSFHQIVSHWHWAKAKVQRVQKWSDKYGRYGVGILAPLSPFLGAYVCIAIGFGTGWKPLRTLLSTLVGMVLSVFLITYAGHWIAQVFSL